MQSRTVRKAPLQSAHTERNGATRPSYINYCLKSEVSIMLRCQLCSTHYTAVRTKNCLKSTSATKIATMKNTDNFRNEGKPSRFYLFIFLIVTGFWKNDPNRTLEVSR